MKNIWLHSFVIVFLAGILLAVTKSLASPFGHIISGLFSNPQAALDVFTPPAAVLALLAPGVFSGWFVRRHPLLVGAAAGAFASLLANQISPREVDFFSLIGDALASALVVAVAALAGRALRYRFKPEHSEISHVE